MKEADVVTKIEETLKRQLPGVVVLKINDISTMGIPDVIITYGGHTTFIEVKLLREAESPSSFRKHFNKLQLATCRLLERQGRCYYFIAFDDNAAIVRPATLARYLEDEENDEVGSVQLLGGYVDKLSNSLNHLSWLARR